MECSSPVSRTLCIIIEKPSAHVTTLCLIYYYIAVHRSCKIIIISSINTRVRELERQFSSLNNYHNNYYAITTGSYIVRNIM